MIIGNYMLLNLFLAILLKFISEGDEEENKDDIWSDYTERKVFELVKRKDDLMEILRQL